MPNFIEPLCVLGLLAIAILAGYECHARGIESEFDDSVLQQAAALEAYSAKNAAYPLTEESLLGAQALTQTTLVWTLPGTPEKLAQLDMGNQGEHCTNVFTNYDFVRQHLKTAPKLQLRCETNEGHTRLVLLRPTLVGSSATPPSTPKAAIR